MADGKTFTDEEIAEIMKLLDATRRTQYIGARYVPIFGRKGEPSIEWDDSAPYEPLTIVLYQGNSYTSRQYVPAGVEITNGQYWANTGNYNAQVEQYRQETKAANDKLSALGVNTPNDAAELLTQIGKADAASTLNSKLFAGLDIHDLTDAEEFQKHTIGVNAANYGFDGTDDTGKLQALIDKNYNVYIPSDVTAHINAVTINVNDITLQGGEVTNLATSQSNLITINGDNVTLKNLIINSNDVNFCIDITGNNVTIDNVTFNGKAGHYIRTSGNNTRIINCVFDGYNNEQVTAVQFSQARNCVIDNNIFNNQSGFNVQTLKSSNIIISNNVFSGAVFTNTINAASGQTVFTFNSDITPNRFGVLKNNVVLNSKEYTSVKNNLDVTITLKNPAATNDSITLVAYKSLEFININASSDGITIDGNTLRGSGDSGIVLCNDYNSDPALHAPTRVTCENNTIDTCLAAGIALTHTCDTITITDNTIYNCGRGAGNSNFRVGVFATGSSYHVANLAIYNTDGEYMHSGVFVSNPTWPPTSTHQISIADIIGNTRHIINLNGSSRSNARSAGIITPSLPTLQYPSPQSAINGDWSTNKPANNTDYWSFSAQASGGSITGITDTVTNAKTIQFTDGAILDLGVLDRSLFANANLTLMLQVETNTATTFDAIVYYQFDNVPLEPGYTVRTANTNGKYTSLSIPMALAATASDLKIRFRNNDGVTKVRGIALAIQPLP